MAALFAFLTFGVILLVVVAAISTRDPKPQHTLNKKDAALYREAAAILNRLVNVTDLDGDFAKDVVSPDTRQVIDDWLARYRTEIEKVK